MIGWIKSKWKTVSCLLIVGAAYAAFSLLNIGCPIRALTGFPCAGCGMTRAYLALLRLDFRAAFYYHPLFWTVPVALLLFMARKGPLANTKVRVAAACVMIAAFTAVYVLRAFFIKDSAIYIFK